MLRSIGFIKHKYIKYVFSAWQQPRLYQGRIACLMVGTYFTLVCIPQLIFNLGLFLAGSPARKEILRGHPIATWLWFSIIPGGSLQLYRNSCSLPDTKEREKLNLLLALLPNTEPIEELNNLFDRTTKQLIKDGLLSSWHLLHLTHDIVNYPLDGELFMRTLTAKLTGEEFYEFLWKASSLCSFEFCKLLEAGVLNSFISSSGETSLLNSYGKEELPLRLFTEMNLLKEGKLALDAFKNAVEKEDYSQATHLVKSFIIENENFYFHEELKICYGISFKSDEDDLDILHLQLGCGEETFLCKVETMKIEDFLFLGASVPVHKKIGHKYCNQPCNKPNPLLAEKLLNQGLVSERCLDKFIQISYRSTLPVFFPCWLVIAGKSLWSLPKDLHAHKIPWSSIEDSISNQTWDLQDVNFLIYRCRYSQTTDVERSISRFPQLGKIYTTFHKNRDQTAERLFAWINEETIPGKQFELFHICASELLLMVLQAVEANALKEKNSEGMSPLEVILCAGYILDLTTLHEDVFCQIIMLLLDKITDENFFYEYDSVLRFALAKASPYLLRTVIRFGGIKFLTFLNEESHFKRLMNLPNGELDRALSLQSNRNKLEMELIPQKSLKNSRKV